MDILKQPIDILKPELSNELIAQLKKIGIETIEHAIDRADAINYETNKPYGLSFFSRFRAIGQSKLEKIDDAFVKIGVDLTRPIPILDARKRRGLKRLTRMY